MLQTRKLLIMELEARLHGLHAKCTHCGTFYRFSKRETLVENCSLYDFYTATCKCAHAPNVGVPREDGESGHTCNILNKIAAWPQHKRVITELKQIANQVWRTCDQCPTLLHSGFWRQEFNTERRNNCNRCKTSLDWWWSYDDQRINNDIEEFQSVCLDKTR